ncbi:MAG: hypothetical protein AAF772_06695 [Acidobacteriota bacterium]
MKKAHSPLSPTEPILSAPWVDGVQRALGRSPNDFSTFARRVARTEAWRIAA